MLSDIFPDAAYDPPYKGNTLVLAGGCFWCTEGAFREVSGVLSAVSGYIGGDAASANYRAVCEGNTGHAEAVKLTYDPQKTTIGKLLKIFFWLAHDPTQKNRQGHDIGTQYRSAIFYADETQKDIAARYIAQLDSAGAFASPIATTLEPLGPFYEAEAYHQNYAALNPQQGYIQAVAMPKILKVRKLKP